MANKKNINPNGEVAENMTEALQSTISIEDIKARREALKMAYIANREAHDLNVGALNEGINEALETAVSASFETMVLDDGTEIISKEYDMMDKGHGTAYDGKVIVQNVNTIASIEKIKFALSVHNKAGFIVCRELANLNNQKTLSSLGFKNIGELGFKMFGIANTTTLAYARIGKYYIKPDYTLEDGLSSNYTVGHLVEFLPYADEHSLSEIIALSYGEDAKIPVNGSTRTLRSALKALWNTKGEYGLIGTDTDEKPVKERKSKDSADNMDNGEVVTSVSKANIARDELLLGKVADVEEWAKNLPATNDNGLTDWFIQCMSTLKVAIIENKWKVDDNGSPQIED